MLNDSQKALIYAYEKGYRVSEEGIYLNPKGKPLLINIRSNHRYPQSQIRIDGKNVNFLIHRLAAYCFYGEAIFEKGIHVRHLNSNVLDISRKNIALGSASDNELDKSKDMRVNNAKNANSCRKDTRRITLRKLSDDQVREIKRRLNNNEKGADIARDYSVSKDTVYEIKRGNRYTDISVKEAVQHET